MFIDFFYKLRDTGIPVSPTCFLTLQRALGTGLVNSIGDFYISSRAILVKSERYFDLFDQVFAHYFQGTDMPAYEGLELDETARAMLEAWLNDPGALAGELGEDEEKLSDLSPEELMDYFKERLKDQTGSHQRGGHWIGSDGTSPVGHSGKHPGGMRVLGDSRIESAVKIAMDRRYKDYSGNGPITRSMMGEALKRLRHLKPSGPKDQVNIDASIYQTMKNGGEIEIVFSRSLKDRLKVILAIDNGGGSMDPYVLVVQTLFDYTRAQFKDLKTYYFHNTVYDALWKDPTRYKKPMIIDHFTRLDPETRLIMVGDASMAPYELMAGEGSIHIEKRSGKPSIDRLKFLAQTFRHCVWLNPVPENRWKLPTISLISRIFPMFELSLDGLEKAIGHLMAK